MDAQGENLQQLTSSKAEEWGATWINRDEVSFLRQNGDSITRHRLHLPSGKESEDRQPANCLLDDKNMLYNKEGTKGLFVCKGEIYLLDIETGFVKHLTESIAGTSAYPSWGKDESSIIFTNNKAGSNDIYALNLETMEVTSLVKGSANEERGAVSPDGKHLVFSSDISHKGNQDIMLLNMETQETRVIIDTPGTELIARWSGDGEQLYYGSNAAGNWEIYVYDLASGESRRLTNEPAFDGDPRV